MRTTTSLLAAGAIFFALECPAAAQAMLTASAGKVFGGDAPSKKSTWAVALGGGGAHGIGSELEYSETRNFFETADGVAYGKISTLMPGIFVMVPVGKVRPYGILGFGFIRQRVDESVGGVATNLAAKRHWLQRRGGRDLPVRSERGHQSRPATLQGPESRRDQLPAVPDWHRARRMTGAGRCDGSVRCDENRGRILPLPFALCPV